MWTCDLGTGSGKGNHDGNCGCVTPGTMSGRLVTVEKLWTCDYKYSAWEGSPWELKTCDLRYRVWEAVILETVDV